MIRITRILILALDVSRCFFVLFLLKLHCCLIDNGSHVALKLNVVDVGPNDFNLNFKK